ncbi:amino acid kinase [Aurantimonas sp. VKM B-3413]|uniref:amino acid kinase family protein n=1 Tax=Aurantimonas sp. VKM B-3413 TaxID=2779401 RepID=UPI001E540120|nr:amino acid kinase [Aurantimonas sp. VKM B-3413]MCB8838242.1 amino acid kinase [Aurantimonas sp. VKM B-3413]
MEKETKGILVVKFGGSSASSPDLKRWVAAIEQARGPLVVVPGGGPFADTVRMYQRQIAYDDDAAHEMAILAMEQFGCALVSLGQRMVKARDIAAIHRAIEAGKIPVWMPRDLALGAPELAHDWTVTSDSLSAWLAARLPQARLCLFKQIDVPLEATVEALVGAHIVDESFGKHLNAGTRVYVAGPADMSAAGVRLADGDIPGRLLALRRPVPELAAP